MWKSLAPRRKSEAELQKNSRTLAYWANLWIIFVNSHGGFFQSFVQTPNTVKEINKYFAHLKGGRDTVVHVVPSLSLII